MNKDILQEIIEIRLLSERMESKLTKEEVDKRRGDLLLEMAFYRDEFKNYLLNITTTIISHFALIVYSQISNTHTETLNHWKGELRDRIVEFQEMDTKPKSGNRKMVSKVLSDTWFVKLDLPNKPNIVARRFQTKFQEENIIIDNVMKERIARLFIENMSAIIEQMAYGTEQTAQEYVNNIRV